MTKLTTYNTSGGCSCKLSGAQLNKILGKPQEKLANDGADDASFSQLDDGHHLLTSVDFQNPVFDDPKLAGKVAGLNALSDIFACGVHPLWADVLLALPRMAEPEQVEVGRQIMAGLSEVCDETGCEIVGGHTIVLPTPLIGLAVRGLAKANRIKRKSGAQVGDVLLLTKRIGSGVVVAARDNGFLNDSDWSVAIETLLIPNSIGAVLGENSSVTSMTDVTGFGLIGHSVEIGLASRVCLELDFEQIPFLPGARRAAMVGYIPQLALANWQSNLRHIDVRGQITEFERMLISDPQTNGGLLATIRPKSIDRVRDLLAKHGVEFFEIGRVSALKDSHVIIHKENQ